MLHIMYLRKGTLARNNLCDAVKDHISTSFKYKSYIYHFLQMVPIFLQWPPSNKDKFCLCLLILSVPNAALDGGQPI